MSVRLHFVESTLELLIATSGNGPTAWDRDASTPRLCQDGPIHSLQVDKAGRPMCANPIKAGPWENIYSLTLNKVHSAHVNDPVLQWLTMPAHGITPQRFKQNLMEIVPFESINYQLTLLVTRERGRCDRTVGSWDGWKQIVRGAVLVRFHHCIGGGEAGDRCKRTRTQFRASKEAVLVAIQWWAETGHWAALENQGGNKQDGC